jgi:hypothetical protein
MDTDQTSAQQHLDDVGRCSGEAERLLNTACSAMRLQGADYVRIAAQVQAASVYAALAQVSATAAQAAAQIPTTNTQER